QREIGALRGDMTAALDEIQRRVRGGLRGVASAEARVTSGRAREDAVSRARENPTLLGVAGVVVAGAVAYGGYALVARLRERERPESRLRRSVEHFGEELGGRVGIGVESSRRTLERALPRGILVKLDPADSGYMRLTDARLEPPRKQRGQSTVIKKVLW